jgi:hypothetical protein
MQKFTCKQCVHAGEPHTYGDQTVVECRCQPVTVSGFPIVRVDSWCSPGRTDTIDGSVQTGEELVDEGEASERPEARPEDFVTRHNEDGSIITLHIPTVIIDSYTKIKTLEQEVEYLKRER